MSLGFPFGLFALLAAAPVVAAYFLRRRQRPRTVSALFLWRTPSQRAQAGPRWERFSREASLALELLAVALAALFLADVRCGAKAEQRHLVVVVDGSLSMAAVSGGRSAGDAAKTRVAALVREQGATQLTLVESGPKPTVLAGPQAEPAKALSQLEAWRPLQPAHDLAASVTLGRELAGRKQRVWLLTDGPPGAQSAFPDEVEVESVGAKLDNVAFVSAQRKDQNGTAAVTVRVTNFGAKRVEVPVRFSAEGLEASEEKVKLEPNTSAVVRVGLRTAKPVEVRLPDDALVEDGRLLLLPAPEPVVKVAVQEGLSPAAASAVSRFVQVALGVQAGSPATLSFGAPQSHARVRLGTQGALQSFVGPFFMTKTHPVLDDVDLAGVVWTVGENPPGRPLVTAGQAVLVSEADDGAIHLNLDVGRSAVARTGAWPVLLGNLVRRARLEQPGLPRRHLMLGEELPVVTTPGATWRLEGPGGRKRSILTAGAVTLPALEVPGEWKLLKDGEVVDSLAVLAVDPRESDLGTRGRYEKQATSTVVVAGFLGERPRPWWPLVAVLLMLLADFWLTSREARA